MRWDACSLLLSDYYNININYYHAPHQILHIYIHRVYNQNNLDCHSCLAQLKNKLEIEYNICKKDNNELKYRFIYDNL